MRLSIGQTSLTGSPFSACATAGNLRLQILAEHGVGVQIAGDDVAVGAQDGDDGRLAPLLLQAGVQRLALGVGRLAPGRLAGLAEHRHHAGPLGASRTPAWRRRPPAAGRSPRRRARRAAGSVRPRPTAWAFAPAVTAAYTPKVTSSRTSAAKRPIFIRCMESSLAATCWQAGRRRDPSVESRPPDYQHCLCDGSRNLNDSRGVREDNRRFDDGGRQDGKFDQKATWTYMWDTRPKEPPMLQSDSQSHPGGSPQPPPRPARRARQPLPRRVPVPVPGDRHQRPRHSPASVQRTQRAQPLRGPAVPVARVRTRSSPRRVRWYRTTRARRPWGSGSPTCRQRPARPSNAICHRQRADRRELSLLPARGAGVRVLPWPFQLDRMAVPR